jgi:hypothetical protein
MSFPLYTVIVSSQHDDLRDWHNNGSPSNTVQHYALSVSGARLIAYREFVYLGRPPSIGHDQLIWTEQDDNDVVLAQRDTWLADHGYSITIRYLCDLREPHSS